MQRSTLALIFVVAISSTVSAAGIKGLTQQQQQEPAGNLQRLDAAKGPRQQFRPTAPSQPIIVQQQQQILPQAPPQLKKVGPGQITPVFSSKRPIPQAPLPAPAPIALPPRALPAPVIFQQQQQEPEITQQQQQQEPSEIDPNAASAEAGPSVLAPAAAIAAPASEEEANPKPEPYAFTYAFDSGDAVSSGSSSREEQQDASGRVTGFYTLRGQDGRDRRVDYVADANGFRATINTNELGTAKSKEDPADTRFLAQEPSDAQLRAAESATQAARQRAALEAPAAAAQQSQQAERIPAASFGNPSKLSSPRSKAQPPRQQQYQQQQQQQQQPQQQQQQQQLPTQQVRQEADSAEQAAIAQQLQEPIEQIRQTELNSRARKSRQAPFYLFTVA